MRVFVCEFVTGGGLVGEPMSPSLRRAGDMMLRSLVKDLAELPDIELLVTRDRRLDDRALSPRIRWIDGSDDPWTVWRDCIAESAAIWPVAPETHGALERLSGLALAAGCELLGSRPAAVRIATSKRETAMHLAAQGIATIETWALTTSPPDDLPTSAHGWVVKPDDGAGSEETYLIPTRADLRRWLADRRDAPRFVIQPYMPGTAVSLSLLCKNGQARLLACNTQDMRHDGDRLVYHGGTVGAAEPRRAHYLPVVDAVAAALPDLWGHVGIDLIDSEDGPVVVEINPRLTTTYAGLRTAIGVNVAGLVMQLVKQSLNAVARALPVPATPVKVDADAG